MKTVKRLAVCRGGTLLKVLQAGVRLTPFLTSVLKSVYPGTRIVRVSITEVRRKKK